ncbi:MAG: glycosyltransferase family 39 protein [Chitinophagales bacterium]|nr:glycosyltransferase family 39 protein [Chitinophagales bacterium]
MSNPSGNNTRLIACITIIILTSMLMLDRLVPEGLFLDGVTYAAISRNLAIGKGSFWALYYRNPWIFSEHPPLFFGLQAIFFKIFGDHYLTEKIYSFVIWLLTAILLKQFWNRAIPGNGVSYSYALPLLLWCLVPTITWGYTNNILDCTMALFDIAAVWTLYRSLKDNNMWGIITCGILIFCATLTKGPVGAFPLAVPGLYWLVYQRGSGKQFFTAVMLTIFLTAMLIAFYVIFYQFPGPRASFDRYLNQQLIAALSGQREITTGGLGRWQLLYDLAIQMLVPIAITIILIVIVRLLKLTPQKTSGKHALFFLLIGLAASTPIMMSVKQRTFYLVPSLPYYVLAVAAIAYPYFLVITNRFKAGQKGLRIFRLSAIIVSLGLCIYLGSKVGQVGRDHEMISNMHYLAEKFPKGEVLGICAEAEKDYAFLAYLERYNQMEVNRIFYAQKYVLIDKELCNNDIIPIINSIGFREEPIGLSRYKLYHRHFPLKFDFTLLNPVFRTRDK